MIQSYNYSDFCALQRTYEWYKDGNSLLHEDEALVWKYLSVISRPETPLHEEQIPTWSKARGSRRNRCFIVEMEDGDSVMVTYKVVNLMKSRFIHIINIPVSMDGSKENAVNVISELRRDRFVRFLHYECFKEYYGKSERAETYDNYYIDLNDFKKNALDNGNWKKRHHVNAFERHVELFKMEQFNNGMDEKNVLNAIEARRIWRREKMLAKQANGSSGTLGGNSKRDTLEKAFMALIMDGSGMIKSTTLKCDGDVFALETSLVFNGYATSFFIVHAGRRHETDSIRRHVFRDSTFIVRYFQLRMMMELGVGRFYILGSGGEPNLSRYKHQICNGRMVRCYIDKNK